MDWKPNILVVGPGGIKGYFEIGIIKSLYDRGILSDIKEYVGVSIGSIISLLIVSGFTVNELLNLFVHTDIFTLLQINQPKTITSNVSIFSSKPIRDFLTTCMQDKLGFVPTLKQLYLITGKLFTAVTLNYTQKTVEFINANTEPFMSVVDAVTLSINIPGLFDKIQYRGNLYIDGALGNPYPVDAYDDGKTNILGITVKVSGGDDTVNYLSSNVDCPLYFFQRSLQSNASNKVKHITMEIEDYPLNPSSIQKMEMIERGMSEGDKFNIDDVDIEPHVVIKSTFSTDTIETSKELEDVILSELPTLKELVDTIVRDSKDTGKLIDVLHNVLDYVKTTESDEPVLMDLIKNIPDMVKHVEEQK